VIGGFAGSGGDGRQSPRARARREQALVLPSAAQALRVIQHRRQ
jgi:hypothetical protein